MSILPEPIAVLYGGPSREAEVSVVTAKGVASALEKMGIPHFKVEYGAGWLEKIKSGRAGFVFNAMHGVPGEDGSVQAILDLEGYSYNGSGVLASALAMNKSMAKRVFSSAGIDVAKERIFSAGQVPLNFDSLEMDFPVVLKPVSGGSSVCIHIVESETDWQNAVQEANALGEGMMVEEYLPGRELTVAVVGGQTLGVMEITTGDHHFYNYDSKYQQGGSHHHYPAEIPSKVAEEAERMALAAHLVLGCKGATRSDFRFDEKTGRLTILEVNTLPGMTPSSLVPEMASHRGMSYEELVKWMIEDGLCRNVEKAA